MGEPTLTVLKIPISVIISWPQRNYVNPEHRTWATPFSIVLNTLSALMIGARLYARIQAHRKRGANSFGVDDVLIVLAWIFATAYTAVEVVSIQHGTVGLHIWDSAPETAVFGAKLGYAASVLLTWSNCLIKASILLFYRRLMNTSYSAVFQWAIYGAMFYVGASLIGLTAAQFTICKPLNAFWDAQDLAWATPYQCRDIGDWNATLALVLLASDVFTLGLPLILIMRLRLPGRQKLMLAAVFGCGIIAVVAGAFRTYYGWVMFVDKHRDMTWRAYSMFVWVEVELHTAMICASVPALKGFFTKTRQEHRARRGILDRPAVRRMASTLPSFVRARIPTALATVEEDDRRTNSPPDSIGKKDGSHTTVSDVSK